MIFRKVYIFFKNELAIKNLNIQSLITEIFGYRRNNIYGYYLGTKYAHKEQFINIINSISDSVIKFKFYEECVEAVNEDGTTGYILTLSLDDEPSEIRQSITFEPSKWNTERALIAIPTARPAVSYNNTVKRTTRAADGATYMLSKCDTYFISPTLEAIEEVYGDLVISSPLPLSVAVVANVQSIKQFQIVMNSSSISSPIVQNVPDNFWNNYVYFMVNRDPTQMAICSLITIISNDCTILFYDDRSERKPIFQFDIRSNQNFYAYQAEGTIGTAPNYNYYIDPNNGDISVGLGRFDHHISYAFKKRSNAASISAIWGYYNIATTKYKNSTQPKGRQKLIPIENKILMSIGNPTYNITSYLTDLLMYTPLGFEEFSLGKEMKVVLSNNIPFLNFIDNNPNSLVFTTQASFIKFDINFNNLIDNLKIRLVKDKTYLEFDANGFEELDLSAYTAATICMIADEPLPDPATWLQLGTAGSKARLDKDTWGFNDARLGKFVVSSIGIAWTYVPTTNPPMVTFATVIKNGAQQKNQIIGPINIKKAYAFRFYYTGQEIAAYNDISLQGTDLQAYMSPVLSCTTNQLYSFTSFKTDAETLFFCMNNIYGLFGPGTVPTTDVYAHLVFEVYNSPPTESSSSVSKPLELPTALLASTLDYYSDTNYFNFTTKLYEENLTIVDDFVPTILRQDFDAVIEDHAISLDATYRSDYYAIKVPNFQYIFPLKGFEPYINPYDKMELRIYYNNKVTRTLLPKGYSIRFTPIDIETPTNYTRLVISDTNKSCIFYNQPQLSSYDVFITFEVDRTAYQHLYRPYSRVTGHASIANCAGTHPIQVYSNLIKSYYDLAPLCISNLNGNVEFTGELFPTNIFKFEIKLPVINIAHINTYNITAQTSTANLRQLLFTMLLELNFYN